MQLTWYFLWCVAQKPLGILWVLHQAQETYHVNLGRATWMISFHSNNRPSAEWTAFLPPPPSSLPPKSLFLQPHCIYQNKQEIMHIITITNNSVNEWILFVHKIPAKHHQIQVVPSHWCIYGCNTVKTKQKHIHNDNQFVATFRQSKLLNAFKRVRRDDSDLLNSPRSPGTSLAARTFDFFG